jgi:hypothetical protein
VLICKVGSVLCGIPPIAFSTEALYVATPWHTAPTDNEVIRMHASINSCDLLPISLHTQWPRSSGTWTSSRWAPAPIASTWTR